MAIDLARLRTIARGDYVGAEGRIDVTPFSSHVSAPPVTRSGYFKKAQNYAVYVGYAKKHTREEEGDAEGVSGGVFDDVTIPTFANPRIDIIFEQGLADDDNRDAIRRHLTDRWCRCGRLAPCEWFDLILERRVWICDACLLQRDVQRPTGRCAEV